VARSPGSCGTPEVSEPSIFTMPISGQPSIVMGASPSPIPSTASRKPRVRNNRTPCLNARQRTEENAGFSSSTTSAGRRPVSRSASVSGAMATCALATELARMFTCNGMRASWSAARRIASAARP